LAFGGIKAEEILEMKIEMEEKAEADGDVAEKSRLIKLMHLGSPWPRIATLVSIDSVIPEKRNRRERRDRRDRYY
jgi:hypothetical protein